METENTNDKDGGCQSTNSPSSFDGRTIEIDDAGTGDLVGDAFIGFRDTNSGKIIFKSIPVGLYSSENRDVNRPKEHILKIIKKGLKELNHNEKDRILLCRGNCFDLVREYFKENNIYYEPAIVEGKLQDAVEGRFVSHLRKLGVTSKKLSKESGARRYFILFEWVCRDFPNRKKYVKTGFPSWDKKWKKIAMERYEKYQNKDGSKLNKIKERAKVILMTMANEKEKISLKHPSNKS